MEYIAGAILLIVIWLVWSRYSMNKEILAQLDLVNEDSPVQSNISLKEYLRYCNSLIVDYNEKIITISVKDSFSYLFIQK